MMKASIHSALRGAATKGNNDGMLLAGATTEIPASTGYEVTNTAHTTPRPPLSATKSPNIGRNGLAASSIKHAMEFEQ